jgi:hypothetical protein
MPCIMHLLARFAIAAALVPGTLAAGSSRARAQELWSGSGFGMTVPQVLAVVPGARAPAYPGSLRTGAVELLSKPGVSIGGESFTAHFYFQRDGLQEVLLLLDGKRRTARLLPIYDKLETMLAARYGAPAATQERNGSMLQWRSASWRSGQTEIVLAVLRGGDSANLNITYRLK